MKPATKAALREEKRLRWIKVEAGKRWRLVNSTGKILGFVTRSFGAWDAYVLTGKKWPESERSVTPCRYPFDLNNPFFAARRAVVDAVRDDIKRAERAT